MNEKQFGRLHGWKGGYTKTQINGLYLLFREYCKAKYNDDYTFFLHLDYYKFDKVKEWSQRRMLDTFFKEIRKNISVVDGIWVREYSKNLQPHLHILLYTYDEKYCDPDGTLNIMKIREKIEWLASYTFEERPVEKSYEMDRVKKRDPEDISTYEHYKPWDGVEELDWREMNRTFTHSLPIIHWKVNNNPKYKWQRKGWRYGGYYLEVFQIGLRKNASKYMTKFFEYSSTEWGFIIEKDSHNVYTTTSKYKPNGVDMGFLSKLAKEEGIEISSGSVKNSSSQNLKEKLVIRTREYLSEIKQNFTSDDDIKKCYDEARLSDSGLKGKSFLFTEPKNGKMDILFKWDKKEVFFSEGEVNKRMKVKSTVKELTKGFKMYGELFSNIELKDLGKRGGEYEALSLIGRNQDVVVRLTDGKAIAKYDLASGTTQEIPDSEIISKDGNDFIKVGDKMVEVY